MISVRKGEHVRVALEGGVEPGPCWWEEVELLHEALPEVDLEGIDLSTTFCGKPLRYPVLISALTGGFEGAEAINAALATAAEVLGIGLEVGSQRAMVESPELEGSYRVVREVAPRAFIAANIGVPQLLPQGGRAPLDREGLRRAIEVVEADALVVHLNFLQEAVMAEGDRRSRGALEAVGELIDWCPVPVVVKETGSGVTRPLALKLKEVGVRAIEVAGTGGTSMALLEAKRASLRGDGRGERLGRAFARWGVPAPVALLEAKGAGLEVVASGGIRDGLHGAKALALGADLVAVGRPALQAACQGAEAVLRWLEGFLREMEVASALTGAKGLEELKGRGALVFGRLKEWMEQLGHRPSPLNIRGRVFSGAGEGRRFVALDWAMEGFRRLLGFSPFPGTLNLKVLPSSLWALRRLRSEGLWLRSPEGGFCDATLHPVLIRGIRGAVVVPHVAGYPEDVAEVLAPVELRAVLGLDDGQELTLEVLK